MSLTEISQRLLDMGGWETVAEGGVVILLALWSVYLAQRSRWVKALEDRQDSLFRNNMDAVAILDPRGAIERVNNAFLAITGLPESGLVGGSVRELVPPSQRGAVLSMLRRTLKEGIGRNLEVDLRRAGLPARKLEITSVPMVTRDRIVGSYLVLRDITQQKEIEQTLEQKALHDPLTGLPNRTLFDDRIRHAMKRVQRKERRVAVLYLDLDGFKEVNDSAGHAAGDALLREVAKRLGCFMREGDTVARLGGDEFAILLEEVEEDGDAVIAAERVSNLFEAPVELEGEELRIRASIGVAISSADTESIESLLREADSAMYRAKRSGGDRHWLSERSREGRLRDERPLDDRPLEERFRGEALRGELP